MFTSSSPSALASRLAYAGLIPFILLASLLWIVQADLRPWLTIALTSYAALIASFLGGIHWGIAAQRPHHEQAFHFLWGITPSLIAWLALIMPAYAGLPLLAALLVVCYLVDCRSYVTAGWSAWLPLRLRLTGVATLSCLIGAGAI
jgi:FtsH-binding integral membrane protein